jgi:hypothetical protein
VHRDASRAGPEPGQGRDDQNSGGAREPEGPLRGARRLALAVDAKLVEEGGFIVHPTERRKRWRMVRSYG